MNVLETLALLHTVAAFALIAGVALGYALGWTLARYSR